MKIGLRILLGYFLIVGLAAWFLLNVFVEQVKPGVRSTLESTLVDTANLLAEFVAADVGQGTLQQSAVAERIHAYTQRAINIKINGVPKRALDYRITVTDARGIVVFDSEQRDIGKDYSRWNDVYLTLRGQYGARSTREEDGEDAGAVMHVAAPIMENGKLLGVLTVAKPMSSVQAFVGRSQRIILQRGSVLLLLSLLIGIGFALWLTRVLHKLMAYIVAVESGEKVALPELGKNEIGTLAHALESMRVKLDGKQYIEELMHTLAHELKSPIAAIRSAAELLTEPMPESERARFLATILEQNGRQQQLIDKLLALIRVEKQQNLDAPEVLSAATLLARAGADIEAALRAGHLSLQIESADLQLRGDALLLRQAIGNLLDNAAAFAPAGSRIMLTAVARGRMADITVRDQGAGIPDYALPRLFDRFYSVARPDGRKSTGLGLPFVREVMALHGGEVNIANAPGGGVGATLLLPLA